GPPRHGHGHRHRGERREYRRLSGRPADGHRDHRGRHAPRCDRERPVRQPRGGRRRNLRNRVGTGRHHRRGPDDERKRDRQGRELDARHGRRDQHPHRHVHRVERQPGDIHGHRHRGRRLLHGGERRQQPGGGGRDRGGGAALFTNLSISGTAGPHTLGFSAQQFTPITSATVNVTAGAATQIAMNAGNGQNATTGTAVAIPPSVIVRDASNNPVAGVAVTFAPGTSGGTVTGANQTTDATGIAAVGTWTLGKTAGPYTLTATAPGL